MAYELDPTQPLDAEVRRIAIDLLDDAVEQIDGADAAIRIRPCMRSVRTARSCAACCG